MERIRMALVGCGGMGTRHLYGLSELAAPPFCNQTIGLSKVVPRNHKI